MVIIAISTYPMESAQEVAKRLMAQAPLPTYITMKGPYSHNEAGVGVKVIAIYEFDGSKYSEAFEFIFARYAKYIGVPGFTSSFDRWVDNGKINLQFQTTKESLQIAEESGDALSKGEAYVSHGISCYAKRLLGEAERYLFKGLEFCEKIKLASWDGCGQFHLGETYFEIGDFLKSKEYYEKGSLTLERYRILPSWVLLGKVGSARSKVMNKEKDVDLGSLYAHSRNNKMEVAKGWIQKCIGEILLNIDDQHISEAEHWIQKAIESDQRNRKMFHLGKDYALYADLFKRKGDRSKAQENLGKAIEILKECGADGWVEKYKKELAMIS